MEAGAYPSMLYAKTGKHWLTYMQPHWHLWWTGVFRVFWPTCFWAVGGNPNKHREYADVPGPSCCEVTVLPTEPLQFLAAQNNFSIQYVWLHFELLRRKSAEVLCVVICLCVLMKPSASKHIFKRPHLRTLKFKQLRGQWVWIWGWVFNGKSSQSVWEVTQIES